MGVYMIVCIYSQYIHAKHTNTLICVYIPFLTSKIFVWVGVTTIVLQILHMGFPTLQCLSLGNSAGVLINILFSQQYVAKTGKCF